MSQKLSCERLLVLTLIHSMQFFLSSCKTPEVCLHQWLLGFITWSEGVYPQWTSAHRSVLTEPCAFWIMGHSTWARDVGIYRGSGERSYFLYVTTTTTTCVCTHTSCGPQRGVHTDHRWKKPPAEWKAEPTQPRNSGVPRSYLVVLKQRDCESNI